MGSSWGQTSVRRVSRTRLIFAFPEWPAASVVHERIEGEMPRINPFAPTLPIHPGMFVGRVPELERLETVLVQTRAGNPTNFMITGERGIGKSSLLNYLKVVAEGEFALLDDLKTSFLVIDTDIDGSTTRVGLLRKIELAIQRSLGTTEAARSFVSKSLEFLTRVEAGGIGLKERASANPETLLDEFSYSMAQLVERVCGDDVSLFGAKYDGVLILIDEADNASPDLALGSFLKLFSERLQRRGCNRLALGLAGLPELRGVLTRSHASSLRLFEELVLDRLSDEEVSRVLESGLDRANELNPQKTSITELARGHLVDLSEGYPHFIQQFASSAFSADTDGVIDEQDVEAGALGNTTLGRRGALELIGDRYYRDPFYVQIQTEGYRQVLRIMADNLDSWVSKKELKKRFRGKPTTFDNALHALRERKIILAKEGERGVYRLQHKGFAWWIKLYNTSLPAPPQPAPPTEPTT